MLQDRRRWSSKLARVDVVNDFYTTVGREGEESFIMIKEAFENIANRFAADPRFTDAMKERVFSLAQALRDKGEFDIIYTHRESNPFQSYEGHGPLRIAPGMVEWKNKLAKTEIEIDLQLLEDLRPSYRGDSQMISAYAFLCQVEGLLLWQGIKLDHIERNRLQYDPVSEKLIDGQGQDAEELSDMDMLSEPMIQDFLSSLSPTEMAMVMATYHRNSIVIADEEDVRAILSKWQVKHPQEDGFTEIDLRTIDDEEYKRILEENRAEEKYVLRAGGKRYVPKIGDRSIELLHA